MHKITTNINQLNQINDYASTKPYTTAYADIIKHCREDKYAIIFDEQILRSYPLSFIDEEWLNTDLIENLPIEWTWHSEYKTKRFTIPNSLIINSIKEDNEFKTAIDKIVADSKIDTDILIIETSNNTIVYANSIDIDIDSVVDPYLRYYTNKYGQTIIIHEDGVIDIEDKLIN